MVPLLLRVMASVRFASILLWLLMLVPISILTIVTSKALHQSLLIFFYRGMLAILGVKVILQGAKKNELRSMKNTLCVANHLSYLDVFIYGAYLPVRFTPKKEVRHWPVIGWLCLLTRAMFIERSARQSLEHIQHLRSAIQSGDNVMVFPEATTSNGMALLPFKSTFFRVLERTDENAADGSNIKLRPVALQYCTTNGKPVTTQKEMDFYAWYGDMVLIPHLWALLTIPRSEVMLSILPEIGCDKGANRKALCKESEARIRQALTPAIAPHS